MALKPGGPPLPGDGSDDRHMPGGRRPLGPANGGVTEDWGKGYPEDKGGSVLPETKMPVNDNAGSSAYVTSSARSGAGRLRRWTVT